MAATVAAMTAPKQELADQADEEDEEPELEEGSQSPPEQGEDAVTMADALIRRRRGHIFGGWAIGRLAGNIALRPAGTISGRTKKPTYPKYEEGYYDKTKEASASISKEH
jgi:hypothetical protein